MNAETPIRFETIAELCQRIGCSRSWFALKKAQGLGPRMTRIGNTFRIAPEDAAEWLESLKEPAPGREAA